MHDQATTGPSGFNQLVEENRHALLQLADVMAGLSPEHYQRHFGAQGQHATGKHCRHIIDHYEAFLKATEETGRINYEHRQREEVLETDPQAAVERLSSICGGLEKLSETSERLPLELDHWTGMKTVANPSSIGRELVFLSSHTVHHMAIISLLLEQMGIVPPREFGVNPSTLRHWQRQKDAVEAS